MFAKKILFLGAVGAFALMTGTANAGFECNGQVGFEAGKRCEDYVGISQQIQGSLDRDRTDPGDHQVGRDASPPESEDRDHCQRGGEY